MPDKQQQPDTKKTTQDKGRGLSRRSGETVPQDALLALQSSIGNAALGRMLGARDRAAEEAPTRIDPATQGAIDSRRGGGQALEPGLQEQMEAATGAESASVRIHRDSESDALARGLGATAFTQGRDVFLRSDRDPATDAGRETLTHELGHIARGSTGPGAVMREPATDAPPVPGSPQAEYQASQNNFMAPPPNMLMTGQPGGGGTADGSAAAGPAPAGAGAGPAPGMADPKNLAPRVPDFMTGQPIGLMDQPPEPANKPKGDTWDIEYTMYGKPESFKGLSDEEAIRKLQFFYYSILGDMTYGRQAQESWIKENGESFSSRWTAAAASLAGGADWPEPSEWLKVDEHMFDAFQMLRESLWAVLAARNDPDLDKDARAMAKPLTEERVNQIVSILQRGDQEAEVAWNNWVAFLKDTEKGASRTITGLKVAKVAGAVAATYLTGGLAAEAELGFWGTSLALGAGAGTYGAAQELGNQAGMVWFAGQDSIDWGAVAKAGAVNAAAGFVGGAIGGKFAGLLGNAVGKWIGGMAPEVMEQFGIQGAELLTNGEKLFVQWVAGVGSTPFTSTTSYFLQLGIDGKIKDASISGLLDQIFHDTVMNGAISGFLGFAQANGVGHPVETNTGGGGGETGGGGGGGAAGPSPSETIPGMGAAGPAGEGAPPARVTQQGMGAAGPAGEGAGPIADTQVHDVAGAPTQQQGVATAPTEQMTSQSAPPNVDIPGAHLPTEQMPIGGAPTELQTGVNGPTLPQEAALAPTEAQPAQQQQPQAQPTPASETPTLVPGAAPANGTAIVDPVAASRALADASLAQRPFRLIREPAEVQRSWEADGGQGPAPAAWVDGTGKLNVNADVVPAPVRSADILQGPIQEPGAQNGGGGGQTQASIPPEDTNDYLEEPDENEPWYAGPSEAPRVASAISDPAEAANAYWEHWDNYVAGAEGPPATTYAADVYQANWELAGGNGKAPPAWVDQFGRIQVDANQVDVHSRPSAIETGGGGNEPGGGTSGEEGPTEETGEPANVSTADEATPAAEEPAPPANDVEVDIDFTDITPITTGEELTVVIQDLFRRPITPMDDALTIHDTEASYVEAYQRFNPGKTPPGRGFFREGEIHIGPGADNRTIIHEAIHSIARTMNPDGRMLTGGFVDEGITDMIAVDRFGAPVIEHSYQPNIDFAEFLVDRLGRATVENVVLHGDYATFEQSIYEAFNNEQATADEFLGLMRAVERNGNPAVIQRLMDMLQNAAEFYGPVEQNAASNRETLPYPASWNMD